MNLSTQLVGGRQAITRQRVAILQRLRRNFILKSISLATAVLLYFYVQQERNPMISRVFEVPIAFENLPLDVSIDSDQQQIKITLTGPQPVVDGLKDSDIHIVADLKSLSGDRVYTDHLKLRYDVRMPRDIQALLSFDPTPLPRLDVQVYPQRSKEMEVEAHFPKEANAGYHYGAPVIRPERVHISGRIDRIKRVLHVVADAKSLETGGGIDNDFPLSARDADNNPVEGITMDVQKAHVAVRIQEDPYSKILSVSPIIPDEPPSGYRITGIEADPKRVRVVGRPELIDTLSTLSTEEIPVHDSSGNLTVFVPLVVPRGVAVTDGNGNAISKVTVKITIEKVASTGPQTPGPPSPSNP